jgi:hypothetical protein
MVKWLAGMIYIYTKQTINKIDNTCRERMTSLQTNRAFQLHTLQVRKAQTYRL